jgi:hypothetical protein
MLEWVPSAICFFFGHEWFVPDFLPNNDKMCRRCGETRPQYERRKGRYAWFNGDL